MQARGGVVGSPCQGYMKGKNECAQIPPRVMVDGMGA